MSDPRDWTVGGVVGDRWEVFGNASGGMGQVYFVRDRAWGGMPLAVKSLRTPPGATAGQVMRARALFMREAQVWLDLGDHPNVVTGFYTLELDGALRFFMEYVPGHPLQAALDLPLRPALDVAIQIACALEFAHARGVVHRDLKPANCLVTDDGVVRVTDFGLGKHAAEADLTSGAAGTPHYMPPEQWRSLAAAGPPADVYAFGVILYRLLEGVLPFDAPRSDPTAWFNALRTCHERVAPPPFTRPIDPRLAQLARACLAKDPAQRPTFADVRSELLAGHGAYPRELPSPLATTDVGESNRAVSYAVMGRRDEARRILDAWLARDPHALYPWVNRRLLDRVDLAALRAELEQEIRPHHAAALAADPALVAFDRAIAHPWLDHGGLIDDVACTREGDRAITVGSLGAPARLWDLGTGALVGEVPGTRWAAVACDATGRFALGSFSGEIEVRDRAGAGLARARHPFGQVRELAFVARGTRLLVVADQLAVLDAATGAIVHASACRHLAHDDDHIVALEREVLVILDTDGRVLDRRPALPRTYAGAIAGRTIVTGHDGHLRWNEHVIDGFSGLVSELALSPGGLHLAAASTGGATHVYDLATGGGFALPGRTTSRATRFAFAGPGTLLAMAPNDDDSRSLVERWDLVTRTGRRIHDGPARARALPADGRLVVIACGAHARTYELVERSTAGWPFVVHRRTGAGARRDRLRERDRLLARLAADDVGAYADARQLHTTDPHLARDGELLAAIDRLGRRRGIAVGIRDLRRTWAVATGDTVLLTLVVSPDGTRVATGGRAGLVSIHSVATGELRHALPRQATWATALCWSPAGVELASVAAGGVDLWHVASGTRVRRIEHRAPIARVHLLADRAVVLCTAGTLAVIAGDGRVLAELAVGPAPHRMVVTADRFVGVADAQAPILSIVELATGAVTRVRADHVARSLAVSPDGQWFVTGSSTGTLTLWDPATLQMIAGLAGTDHVNDLALSPAGRFLAIASASSVQLLDLITGDVAATLPGQQGASAVGFTAEGALLTSWRGELARWDIDHEWAFVPEAVAEIRAWLDHGTTGRIWPASPATTFERVTRAWATLARLGASRRLLDELIAIARRERPAEAPIAFCSAQRRTRLLDPVLAGALFG